METAAGLSTLTIFLLVIVFLCALPGLITGWMLKASGRSFFWGFVLGTVFGPLGFLVAVIFLLVGKPPQPQPNNYQVPAPQQPYYTEPGQYYAPPPANSSVPWAVATVSIVVGVFALGVAGYVIMSNQRPVNALQPTFTSLAPAQPMQPVIAAPTPQAAFREALPAATPVPTVEVVASPSPEMSAVEPSPVPDQPAAAPVVREPEQPTSAERDYMTAYLMESFKESGIEVAVEFRGTGKTILSLASSSLTKPLVERWLEVPRTRASLQGLGVRSIIISNGSDAWSIFL